MAILNCLGQILYLDRTPRIKETLSDFREGCRVTRHPRVFRGLTGCQRTPRDWGVTILGALLGTTIMKKYVQWEKKYQDPVQISILHTYYMFMVVMS